MMQTLLFLKNLGKHVLFFLLKHATESNFLSSIDVLFQSLVAETMKDRPLSVSLLYLGQTALVLEYLVLRECRLLFKMKCSFR